MQCPRSLVLYYSPGACSTAAHIALEESGLAYQARCVSAGGEVTKEALRAINPNGKVPALVADGALLTETVAILSLIASFVPGLMPETAWGRALCLSRMAWFASSVHIAFRQTRRPERFTAAATCRQAVRQAGHRSFREALSEIDAMLAQGLWIGGDHFSVADAYALVFFGWGLDNGYDMGAYRAFSGFARRCVARRAVARVLVRERSALLQLAR